MISTEKNGNPASRQAGSANMKNPRNDYRQKKPTLGFRDVREFILKIIIAILIIIAWIIYYRMQERVGPYAWFIFIVLIILIIWLIWRQRHFINLKCSLTAPNGCIQGHTDIISGRILEPVVGSAYGAGFDHYIIEVRDPDGNLLSDVVIGNYFCSALE